MRPEHVCCFTRFVSALLLALKTSVDGYVPRGVPVVMRLVVVDLAKNDRHLLIKLMRQPHFASLGNGMLTRATDKPSPV